MSANTRENEGLVQICTECGKKFEVYIPSMYQYKSNYYRKEDLEGRGIVYQCSYTCYDHYLLRTAYKTNMPVDKFNESIDRCERMMKAQNKEILHPIKKRVQKNGKNYKY